MSSSSRLLHRAIQLIQDGRREDARRILAHLLAQDPNNQTAWDWYVSTYNDATEKTPASPAGRRAPPSGPPAAVPPAPEQPPPEPFPPWLVEPEPSSPAQPPPDWAPYRPGRVPVMPAAPKKKKTSVLNALGKAARVGCSLLVVLLCLAGTRLWWAGDYEALRASHASLSEEYLALQQKYLLLESSYHTSEAKRQDLHNRYTLLEAEHSRQSEEHASLQAEHTGLQLNHTILQSEHAALQAEHAALQAEHIALQAAHATLQAEHTALQAEHATLVEQHRDLLGKAIQPPYIYIHQRTLEFTFYRLDGSLWSWYQSFEGLESAILRGHQTRSNLPTEQLHHSTGEWFTVADLRVFIDPDPFREVISNLYMQSASADAFIREVWYIVTQLNDYADEEEEIPRYPAETLAAGGGDCEDTAILFASMIKAAPVDWQVDLVSIDANHPRDPQTVNHVIVHINTGERDYLIETTGDEEMEPYTEGVVGWYSEI